MSASMVEEENPVIPWVGLTCYKKIISVLLISSDFEILDRINNALLEMQSKSDYPWKLQTTLCKNISDVIKDISITGNIAIDFIVMALDTSKAFCLEWTKLKLEEVHPDLLRRRVVLVNASGLPIYEMATDPDSLLKLQEEMDLDLFNANVFDYEDAIFLARRLLTYFGVVLGVKTGIPNLYI